MWIRRITVAVAFAAGFLASRPFGCAQTSRPDEKPVVLLNVKKKLTIERQNGTISIIVDATVNGGFSGTISGTMSVSGPVNPSGVVLSAGSNGQAFPFTLSAGERTSATHPPQTGIFTIKTSPGNPTSGTVMYTVAIDPSAQFTTGDSPATVKVVTSP
jgi:hypothetical protein